MVCGPGLLNLDGPSPPGLPTSGWGGFSLGSMWLFFSDCGRFSLPFPIGSLLRRQVARGPVTRRGGESCGGDAPALGERLRRRCRPCLPRDEGEEPRRHEGGMKMGLGREGVEDCPDVVALTNSVECAVQDTDTLAVSFVIAIADILHDRNHLVRGF